MTMKYFEHVICIYFLFFLYKKISSDSTPLPKMKGALKSTQISILRDPNFPSLSQLIFAINSSLDDLFLDSGVSFHTIPHWKIIQNYVGGDFGKVYMVVGEALDVMGMWDIQIQLPNGFVWLL